MTIQIKNFTPAEHIEIDNPEFIQEYLEVMLDENGIEGLQRGLGYIAKGMSQIAEDTEREGGNLKTFDNIENFLKTLKI